MQLDPHYWIFPEAVDPDVCNLIIGQGKDLEAQTAIAGGKVDPDVRRSQIGWFPQDSWVQALMSDHIRRGNAWGFILSALEQVQFTHYGHNEFYDQHMDAFKLEESMRKVSAVLQLSDPSSYEGGELLLQDTGTSEYSAEPKFKPQGSIIVFPSFLYHQVTPVTSGERFSAVAWAIGPQFK